MPFFMEKYSPLWTPKPDATATSATVLSGAASQSCTHTGGRCPSSSSPPALLLLLALLALCFRSGFQEPDHRLAVIAARVVHVCQLEAVEDVGGRDRRRRPPRTRVSSPPIPFLPSHEPSQSTATVASPTTGASGACLGAALTMFRHGGHYPRRRAPFWPRSRAGSPNCRAHTISPSSFLLALLSPSRIALISLLTVYIPTFLMLPEDTTVRSH